MLSKSMLLSTAYASLLVAGLVSTTSIFNGDFRFFTGLASGGLAAAPIGAATGSRTIDPMDDLALRSPGFRTKGMLQMKKRSLRSSPRGQSSPRRRVERVLPGVRDHFVPLAPPPFGPVGVPPTPSLPVPEDGRWTERMAPPAPLTPIPPGFTFVPTGEDILTEPPGRVPAPLTPIPPGPTFVPTGEDVITEPRGGVPAVPEPSTWVTMILGVFGVGAAVRRRSLWRRTATDALGAPG